MFDSKELLVNLKLAKDACKVELERAEEIRRVSATALSNARHKLAFTLCGKHLNLAKDSVVEVDGKLGKVIGINGSVYVQSSRKTGVQEAVVRFEIKVLQLTKVGEPRKDGATFWLVREFVNQLDNADTELISLAKDCYEYRYIN